MEWLKRLLSKREKGNPNAEILKEIQRARAVESVFNKTMQPYDALYKAGSAIREDEFYEQHIEMFDHFITLIETYRGLYTISSGGPKEIVTERYRQAKVFMDDLEQHARALLESLGIDLNMDNDMLKLAHPKIDTYLNKMGDFSSSVQDFIEAYEAAYSEEQESE